jgi:UDP-GlcNAc:undecaprenyl-phosphate GlcNAc-1-phosphate transferase
LTVIIPAGLCFLAAVVLVRILADSRFSLGALDVPNERSLHEKPVPRTGGIGLLGAAAAGWALFSPSGLTGLVMLTGLLGAVTFADDRVGLPVRTRLIVQIGAAALFLAFYYTGPVALLLPAFIALIWMANLYNFMDGSDGLAGGMTVAGFGTYSLAASYASVDVGQAAALAAIAASVAGAAGGFLVWNFHRASVFMGDSGSVPLGFLAAALGIVGWQAGIWAFWFPVLVFSPFIADATITLIKRFRRGEKLTQAHKTHYYQRALRMRLGHRGTALASYMLMAAVAGSALAARDWGATAVVLLLVFWIVAYAGLMAFIDWHWDAFSRDPARAG